MTDRMPQAAQVPLNARVQLAHAAVQVLARQVGADVLFIKGPTTEPGLRAHASAGSDVDVIVRPAHTQRLIGALRASGWQSITDFTSGSAFDHAANYYHPQWGMADVHRTYPGLDRDPGAQFDLLWQTRTTTEVAHQSITVPDPTAQALIVLLHAARTSFGRGVRHPDVATAWTDRSPEHRAAVTTLAERLGAQTPLAVAIGHADLVRHRPDAALWIWFSDGGSRLEEWRARMQMAPTLKAKADVAVRSFGVNKYYLEQRLGHTPTPTEVRREFFRRIGQASRELPRLVGLRRVRPQNGPRR